MAVSTRGSKVSVSSSILSWAVERASDPDAIYEKFPKLTEWLEDQSRPTLRQLEAFSKATSTPLGYFFLADPPQIQLPIPFFRTIADGTGPEPSADLLETVQTMERRQSWMRDFLIDQGYPGLEFVRSARASDDLLDVAKDIRETLNLQEQWATSFSTWTKALENLRVKAEEAGILVVVSGIVGNNTHRKLRPSEFRGFVLVDEYAPLVFINGSDGKAAQMFTFAHELAHLWLGSSAAFDLRELQPSNDKTELACNKVAAEFLVPTAELTEIWQSVSQEAERFQSIARHFKVSELVAARRTLDLGLIEPGEYHDFYQTYLQQEHRVSTGQEGGNFYATKNVQLGHSFALAVVSAAREGKLLYRDAYKLTGLYGSTFEKFSQYLLGGSS
jgi:Zn-dependent peptidase ImmA (M78 family)